MARESMDTPAIQARSAKARVNRNLLSERLGHKASNQHQQRSLRHRTSGGRTSAALLTERGHASDNLVTSVPKHMNPHVARGLLSGPGEQEGAESQRRKRAEVGRQQKQEQFGIGNSAPTLHAPFRKGLKPLGNVRDGVIPIMTSALQKRPVDEEIKQDEAPAGGRARGAPAPAEQAKPGPSDIVAPADRFAAVFKDTKNPASPFHYIENGFPDDGKGFVYMVPRDADAPVANPYDLVVVPYSEADRKDYYTMSAAGVTHFSTSGCTEITNLDLWVKEHDTFNMVMRIPLFHKYKLWKSFSIWRRSVRANKMESCTAVLEKSLFVLNNNLRRTLLTVRAKCEDISRERLYHVDEGRTYALYEFVNEQARQRDVIRMRLEKFVRDVRAVVLQACEMALQTLSVSASADPRKGLHKRTQELGRGGDEASGGDGVGQGMGMAGGFGQKEAMDAVEVAGGDQGKRSYTEMAARRTVCRRLNNFIKLVDYLLTETLSRIVMYSIADLLQVLQEGNGFRSNAQALVNGNALLGLDTDGGVFLHDQEEQLEASEADSSKMFRLPVSRHIVVRTLEDRAELNPDADSLGFVMSGHRKMRTPLFSVDLVLDGGELGFSPSLSEFQDRLGGLTDDFVNTVLAPEKLITHKELRHYIQPSANEHDSVDVSDGPDLGTIIIDDEVHQILLSDMRESIGSAFSYADEYLDHLTGFAEMYLTNEATDFNAIRMREDTLAYFAGAFKAYNDQKKTLGQMPVYSVVGLVLVDSVELRSRFEPSPQRCLTQLESILPALVQRLSLALRNELDEAVRRLSSTPNEMEDFVEYMQFVQTIRTRQDGIQGQFDKVVAMDELMEAYDVPVKPEDRAFFKTLNPTLQTLRASVEISEDEMETKVTDFSARLDGQISKLRGGIMEVKHEAQHDLVLDVSSAVQDVLGFIGALENRIDQCKEEAARFRRYQELFRVQPATFDDLDEVAADIKLKSSLWNGLESWAELLRKWQYAAFDSIDSDDMAMQVKKYLRLCSVVERSLPENDVVKKLHGQVKEFDVLLPIILDLHNPALRARHWDEITAALGRPRQRLVRDEKFTLGSLLEMDVMSCRGQIQEISVAATNEAELDEMLKKLDGVWAALEFDVQPFKDSKDQLILTQVDEVQEQLAESMVTICTIRGSRFMGPVKSLVDEWEENLGLFSRALDAWVQCQRSWIYLESIFSAPDIQRQLPLEAKTFAAVEKNWRNLMLHARDAPNAFNLCCSRDNLATLEFANEQMEIVSAALRNYLEAKRLAFPRFYFLSDEELFEILSRTRNPHAVQPHLLKCFDNIAQLEFRDDSIEIVAMISSEGERVELGRNLKARGSVEQWLSAVESSMVLALRRHMKAGIMSYARTAREGWAMSHPTQVVLVASQIWWAKQVNEALNSEDPAAVLGAIHEQSVKQLNALTAVVRGNLTRLQLETIKALLTLDVHSRDVAEGLITQGIASSGDFEWKRQMRYDWDVTSEVVVVRQATAEFSYRYEFLGGSGRLVITPLTDRCYITLMTAMQMQLGGAPAGPAGTGKTETVKDLAKALANQCFVFNCSDGLEYQMMGRFFSGLCQAGAWACFDEFNRIDIEVLSVVAQQIASIRSAMKRNVTRFVFEGKTVAVNPRCAVFITMNPGYAGRTELPSNLKSLFRPVSMTVADYALIAEILLFSQGFRGALPLSRKIVNLYKLCDEQLSTQSHYDFGMRPLKAVLNMAGRVKREKPDDPEDQLLIGVMRDSTLPKLLDEDVPLFEGILTDLFPSIEMAEDDHAGVRVAARSGAKELSLEVVPEQIENVLQLMLTLNSRHGVMLVGPTGGGKTCVYQILAKALAILHDQQPDKEIYAPVDRFLLNPKSIHIDLLYGVLDEVTTSWVDGIVSMIVRRVIAADEAEEDDDDDDGSVSEEEVVGPKLDSSGNPVISPRTYKWVIFDGPVDALWVENMNTVLDDSKMLCLPNGERIKLNDKLRMLFEVENLEEASPATVSRCGMVYVDAWTVGWKPYLAKWLKSPKLTQLLDDPSHHQRLAELAERYVGPVVEFTLENASSCHIAPVPYNLIAAFCNFFEATLLDVFDYEEKMAAKLEASKAELAAVVKAEEREGEASAHVPFDDDDLEYTALTAKELLALLDLVFVFAIVWGAGGVLKGVQRDSFDGLIRDLVSGEIMLPRGASIFDYVVSPEMRALIPWSEAVDDFSFDPNQPFFDIVVPTVDTVAYSHILERSVAVGIPVLLVGPSGVGKSVVALQMIRKLLEDGEVTSIYIPFSAQTSTGRTQSFIESKMDRREKGVMRGPSGKKVVLFVDNVNLPVPEKYKAQPPIELLRQILDSGGLYDRKKLQWVNIEGLSMISACCPPGGGSMNMTARFTRHLFMVSVPKPSDDTLFNMFKQIADGFFVNFAPEVARLTRVMVQGAISMYRQVEEEMNPTPSRVHYTFNLRDLARVFQGLLAADRFVIQHSKDLIHLWIHECTRVFHDRLNSARDRFAFYEIMSQTTQRYFDLSVSVADLVDSPRLFSRLLRTGGNDAPVYAPMMDNTKVVNALHDFMDDYNMESVSKRLDLVFFEGCVEHVVRLTRVLNQRRGSALLVGMAGTGKRSITRLAAFVAGCKLATIKVSRQYGIVEFREDLKGMFFDAGLRNQSIVLLISDEQIVHSSFWEDVNGFLGCGEIPNLWEADEYERIIGECRPLAADAGIPDRRDRIYDWFVSRVRDNVHLVLTMSPNADSFSERIRMFPALVSCCTIDWHFSWPRNALLDVAEHFMRDIDLSGASETGDVSAALTSATVDVHESVIEVADRFFSELGRKVYVTPSSYLSFLQCFGKNLQGLRGKYGTRRDRLRNGLRKLHESQKLVEEMQRDLSDMQPELKVRAEETDTLLAQVDRDTKVANEMKGRVTAEAQRLEMRTEDIRAEQLAAQQELASAMPALEAAVVAVNSLNKASIAEMKAFNRPPDRVKMVMDGVDILLNETPDWEHSKKVLGDPAFLRRLVDYDKENVDENVMRRLRRHIQANDDFNPADVGQVSVAAKTLCVWVLAISEYDEVYRQVKPKQYRVQHMTEALKRAQEDLAKQGETLAGIQKRLDELKAKFNASLREKSSLKKKIDQTNVRLRRASKLIKALGAEQTRWEEQEQEAASALESVVAAAFLTSASTAYLGPFNDMYRTELYTLWVDMVAGMGLNIPPDQSLVAIMGDPLTIRDWNIKGLPKDKVSTTNAILAQNGLQWPLLIDPQGQANKWVKNMEAENGLTVVRMSDPHMLRALESGIRVGSPVLIEEVPASLDPVLDPVLLKQTFMQGNRTMIRVGDSDVNYDPNFRLYLTSKESNPNLLAETFIKLLVINFAVTPAGLEDRLLRNVVRCERPELEEERDNLIVQMSGDEKTLRDLEEKMLHLMYQSEGNILDDESLIETLNTSKVTSDDIKLRVQQSEETEKEIENAREFYRPVAHRGSILYFVVSELAHVETMYQFSLSYFSSLYEKTIETTAKSENVGRRVADLIDSMATVVFDSVARALFTKDRLVFALMITLLIIHDLGAVDAASIAYLMRPAVPEPRSDPEVIAYSDDLSSWCSELQWFTLMDVCYRLGSVFTVKGVNSLDKLLRENLDELEAFSKSPTPWAHPLPLQIAAAGPDGPESVG